MKTTIQSYLSLSGKLKKSEFANRFSSVLFLTFLTAGYFWVLSLYFPKLFVLPLIFLVITVIGHTLAAVQVYQRLETIGDDQKSRFLIFIPYFGVMYGLPTALKTTDSDETSSKSSNTSYTAEINNVA